MNPIANANSKTGKNVLQQHLICRTSMTAGHCPTNVKVDAGCVQPQLLDRARIGRMRPRRKLATEFCRRRDPIVDTICAAVRARDALA